METKIIRTLRANEIECRVQSVKESGCVLLIYKDARVDMRILDEVYGIENWQRTHEVINSNLFCNIEIWCDDKKQWIKKQDVGVESKTEQQKGEASDSFKRACFNVGIGRELYSAPFIWIPLNDTEINKKDGKVYLKYGISFCVKEIDYDLERNISKLTIIDNKKIERFKFNINGLKDEQKKTKENSIEKQIELAKKLLDTAGTIENLNFLYNSLEPHLKIEEIINYCKKIKTKLTPKE